MTLFLHASIELCKSGEGNRTIQINRMLEVYRAQARQNLDSERSRDLRKRRGVGFRRHQVQSR